MSLFELLPKHVMYMIGNLLNFKEICALLSTSANRANKESLLGGFVLDGDYRVALKPGYKEWFKRHGISFGKINLSLTREVLGYSFLTDEDQSISTQCICCSVDCKRLIMGSDPYQLSVWSTRTWERLSTFDLPDSFSAGHAALFGFKDNNYLPTVLLALPDGRIACGCQNGFISVLSLEDDIIKPQMILMTQGNDRDVPATAICLTLDGFLIVGYQDSSLRKFSISPLAELQECRPSIPECFPESLVHQPWSYCGIRSLILLRSGLVASSQDRLVRLWKPSTGRLVGEMSGHDIIRSSDFDLCGICAMQDNKTIAVAFMKNTSYTLYFWTPRSEEHDLSTACDSSSSIGGGVSGNSDRHVASSGAVESESHAQPLPPAPAPAPACPYHTSTFSSLIPLLGDDGRVVRYLRGATIRVMNCNKVDSRRLGCDRLRAVPRPR